MFSKRPAGILWRNVVVAVLVLNLLLPSWANAFQIVSKTSSEETITEGVVLETVRLKTDEGPLNVYILKADLTNPYLKVDTIVGEDGTLNKNQPVTAMARRTGAVAAINGDFFQMKDSGRPIGLLYKGGRLLESPALRSDMYGFGLTREGLPLLEVFQFAGQVTAENGKKFPLAGLNKPGYLLPSESSSDVDSLLVYDSSWGASSRGKHPELTGVVEAVVKNGVVMQVLTDQPGVSIPPNGFILRGHGQAALFIAENLPVGAKVSYDYSVSPDGDKLLAAVGGQALLVEDGHLPAYFTQNIKGNHARTAVGISRDGRTLYLVAVEKQASNGSGGSRGMSQEELAGFLISRGVWRAVNLDGGGSTTLAARHLGDFEASLINSPQNSTLRPVPNAIGLFSTAPPGALKGLAVSGPAMMLAGTRGEFNAKGYDQYYNPSRIDPAKVAWTVEPAAGEFRGGVFVPGRGGTFTVSASLGSTRGSARVEVIGPESISALAVSPSAITVEPGKSVKLTVKVITNFGEQIDLKNEYVKWSVDDSLGKISEDKFIAGGKIASGEIRGTFQGFTASVPVSVELPGVELQAAPEKDAGTSLDQKVSVFFPAGSLAAPAKIKLACAEVPGDLPAGLVPREAVTVNPSGGQSPGLNAPWRISWGLGGNAAGGRPALLLWDESLAKWRELPSLVEENGDVKTISARVWGFGRIALVEDHRPAPSFKDTGKHWARPAIQELAARGVIRGFPDGTFGPDQKVTRVQFVSLLAVALQWPVPEDAPVFKDRIPEWARPAVAAAVSRGVVTGYPDGTFAPDARITRSEMAVIISRALNLSGDGTKLTYADAGKIPVFAREAVGKVTAAGLMKGSDGSFRPLDGATRAETAVAVERLLNLWASQ